MAENSLQNVVQIREVYTAEEVNRLLPLGWRLIYITTVKKQDKGSNLKVLVYVLGRGKGK